jgi:thioredoxin reductase
MEIQDCIIVGGGPAGLNAAVVLGRCRRKVLVFDTSEHRNRWSQGMHNYLTRDDILPADFLNLCHRELEKYSVQLLHRRIVSARKNEEQLFVVRDDDGRVYHSKRLLVATGLADHVPAIEGFDTFYGHSVFHCPYCDGWEVREKIIGVYARNKEGWELALNLKAWTNEVTLYTDGKNKVKPEQEAQLKANDIAVVRLPIARLEGSGTQLENIVFKDGSRAACDALFFVNGYEQQCNLAEVFGCEINRKGAVVTNRLQQTNVPGLYVAGDAAKDMHFVVVAAAEGAKAAVIINKELQKEISDKNFDDRKAQKA